jgi:hypothetical protein
VSVLWNTLDVYYDLEAGRYLVSDLGNGCNPSRFSGHADPRQFSPNALNYYIRQVRICGVVCRSAGADSRHIRWQENILAGACACEAFLHHCMGLQGGLQPLGWPAPDNRMAR